MMEKYCKLYVHSDEQSIIEEAINSSINLTNLNYKDIFFYIDSNDEKNNKKALNEETGFLYYNYTVDIDSDVLTIEKVIGFINGVLLFLEHKNIKVVASCDYENDLLYKQEL